jgi:hypothetical protein
MATVFNRSTAELIRSVNTPDYPSTYWIINPDLTLVENVPQKYWKAAGDAVVEMSAQEKAAVDAASLAVRRDQIEAKTTDEAFKAVLAALIKVINIRLPVGNKITATELRAAIRAEIEANNG